MIFRALDIFLKFKYHVSSSSPQIVMTQEHDPNLDIELTKLIAEQEADDREHDPNDEDAFEKPAPTKERKERLSDEEPDPIEEEKEPVTKRETTANAVKKLMKGTKPPEEIV